jgi:hypothetical protein
MSESKQCPDCAEQVLAEARKCRFCGYRFGERKGASPSSLERILGIRLGRSHEISLPELLADWGMDLRTDETPLFFGLATFDEQPGYVLVTPVRLAFFATHNRSEHVKLVDYPLSSILQTRPLGEMHRRLEVRGADFTHVVSGDSKRASRALTDCLIGTASHATHAVPGV